MQLLAPVAAASAETHVQAQAVLPRLPNGDRNARWDPASPQHLFFLLGAEWREERRRL